MGNDEDLFEDIRGIKKKSVIAVLNKERISKYELDDIFAA